MSDMSDIETEEKLCITSLESVSQSATLLVTGSSGSGLSCLVRHTKSGVLSLKELLIVSSFHVDVLSANCV